MIAFLKRLFRHESATQDGKVHVRAYTRDKPKKRQEYIVLHRQMASELGREWPKAVR